MNREIKFKAIKIETKSEWVYGGYFSNVDEEGLKYFIFTENQGAVEVYENTISQFTGLTDDNKKNVFEGDILNFGAQRLSTGEIKYIAKNAGFLVKDKWGDWKYLFYILESTNAIIIGNKFDNTELFEK
jgi:uncharacterized phage protein (TIGR01671 family)